MKSYYLRSIEINDTYRLPLIFNSQNNKPSLHFMRYIISEARFKFGQKHIKQRSYAILRFYNFLNKLEINLELTLNNFDSIDTEIELYVAHILNQTSKHKNTTAYRNLIFQSLKDFLNNYSNHTNFLFNSTLLSNYIQTNRSRPNKTERGFPTSYARMLSEFSEPDNTNNPFKPREYIRVRNYIIIHILLETGMRIGELQTLTVNSYKELNQRFYLNITDSEVINDKRSIRPKLKNSFSYRTVSISQNLFNLIHYYVCNLRPTSGHNLLITSENGTPIIVNSIYAALNLISNAINKIHSIEKKLTAHDFRYNFATSFLRHLIEDKGYDMTKSLEELRTIMGWQRNSVMPSKYANEYLLTQANLHNINRIESIL